jgi:hypothetical protein
MVPLEPPVVPCFEIPLPTRPFLRIPNDLVSFLRPLVEARDALDGRDFPVVVALRFPTFGAAIEFLLTGA